MVGRTVGKYRILEQIGRGGMGTVYKALDETLDRTVAIKVLNADLLSQDSVERFRREAVMLARLSHPRIGAIHELTRDGHDLLMVMEYVAGETFENLVEREGTLPLPRAAKLCVQVLDGLQYAHTAGVVHRDLKPANLILMPNSDIKIMDFGIARMQGSEHLTSVGFMVGTPAYMSPEQVRGEEVDPRMDLYSVAVVLYRMLTHHLPFSGDTAIAMIHSQLNNPPTPPRQFRADLPDWMVAILTRGLAKGRGDRFQTAEEFRGALEGGLTGTMPIPAILGPSAAETMGPTLTPPAMRVPAAGTPPPAPAPVASRAPAAPPSQFDSASVLPASRVAAVPSSQIAPQPAAQTAPGQTPPPAPGYAQVQTPLPQMMPARTEATVTLRAPHLATAGILLAVLVAGIAVLAVVALRRPTVVTPQAPSPTASAPVPDSATQPPPIAAPVTTPTPVAAAPTMAAGPPPSPTPATPAPSTSASAQRPTGSGTSPSSASPPAASVPAVTGRATTPAAADAARGRSSPPAETTTASSSAPADAPAQHFPDVRTLVAEGTRIREVDALLSLEPGSLVVRSREEGTVLRTIPYSAMTAATYARARRPRGQTIANAAAVPDNFGGAGFLGGSRHWLTLQTPGEFMVLRLEERNTARIITALERRTGLVVQRNENIDR